MNFGGGFYCNSSQALIRRCIISGNSSAGSGGGISLSGTDSLTIEECVITGNFASGMGGGINCDHTNPRIVKCLITGNTAANMGGGIYCYSASPAIDRCTISSNYGREGGGISCYTFQLPASSPVVVNTILEGNTGAGGVHFFNSPYASFTYCDFNDNQGGNFAGIVPPFLGRLTTVNINADSCDRYYNIFCDPLFQAVIGDSAFRLTENSPCIDAGDPNSSRDPDGTIADMGVFYFHHGPGMLTLSIRPHNPPIMIPAGGGSFTFDAAIRSTLCRTITIDAWTEAALTGGQTFGPLLMRANLILPDSTTITRAVTQYVPGNAPWGGYRYIAKIGVYPDSVVDSDTIDVFKMRGFEEFSHHYGWAVFGWEGSFEPVSPEIPMEPVLVSAHPNPFNPVTVISYQLQAASYVKLAVYDIAGREVASLVNGHQSSGHHEITFDGTELPSGVYFAMLEAGGVKQVRKLLLVK